MNCSIYVAKTKALISCAVTVQLICVFVFAYAKSRFSHDVAQLICSTSVGPDSSVYEIQLKHLIDPLYTNQHNTSVFSRTCDLQLTFQNMPTNKMKKKAANYLLKYIQTIIKSYIIKYILHAKNINM